MFYCKSCGVSGPLAVGGREVGRELTCKACWKALDVARRRAAILNRVVFGPEDALLREAALRGLADG